MDYRTLGRSGCAVSSLCLGTMTFGVETDEAGAHEQLDRFVEAGGTLVDTADVYGGGESEEIIGRWFAEPAGRRHRAGWCWPPRAASRPATTRTGPGCPRRHLTRALDASLRRLGRRSVDLYQVHAFDPWTPLEETLRTLDGFVRAGKIRYYGLSNFTGWQLTKAVHLARALDVRGAGDAAAAVQPAGARDRVGDRARPRSTPGLGLLPWSPLGGGWLSGKYKRDQRPTGATRLGEDPDRGMEAYDRRGTERTWDVIDAVQKVAEDRGVSMAEVALAWVTDRPGGDLDDPRRPHDRAAARPTSRAADLHLTAAETAALDPASDPQPPTIRTARWASTSAAGISLAPEISI